MRTRGLGLLLLFVVAACGARKPTAHPAPPAEESYVLGPAEHPERSRIVVGLLLPTREPTVLADHVPVERLRAIEDLCDEPVLHPVPEPPLEVWGDAAPWGEQAKRLARWPRGPRVVFREVTAEEIEGVPIVLVADRKRSGLEWDALRAYAAKGGLVGSVKEVLGREGAPALERLVRRAIEASPFVRRLPEDPLAVVEARRDGDLVEVRLAERATAAALRDVEGRTLWSAGSAPPNPLRVPFPEPANDPYACRIDLRHGTLRQSYRIVDLVGTTERQILAGNRLLAGGTFAARATFTNTKTGSPVAGCKETFAIERDGKRLAAAEGTSDALGAAEVRLRVPEDATPGPAELVAGSDRFPVTIAREVRLSVVTDRGLYRPDDTVHVRVLGHRFPSGAPAGGETVVLRHSTPRDTDAERKIALSGKGIGSWSLALADAPVGTHTILAEAEGARVSIRFDVRAFETPRFLLTLDPPEIALHPGEAAPVTLRARYVDGSPLAHGEVVVYDSAEPSRGSTDAQGLFRFTLKARPGDASRGASMRVRDADGRTAQASLRVAITDPVRVLSIEPLGDLVLGSPCAFRVVTEGATSATLSVGGGEPTPLALDAHGAAVFEATPPGDEISLRVAAGGASCARTFRAFVPREGQPVVRPARRDATVGETLAVEVSGPPGPLHLDVSRGETLLRALTGSGPLARFDLDLDEAVAGVLTLHGYAGDLGTRAQVLVRRGRMLDVEARPDRDAYRPRETASVDVAVRDREGRPAPAALGYWAVDGAVLALRGWPTGRETVFDVLPGRPEPGDDLAAAAESGGSALFWALGPIEADGKEPHRIRHRQGPDRERAAKQRAQGVLDAHVARLRAAYVALWKDIPLAEVRAFANFRQQLRWLVATGRLDPALLVDPWGEPLATWQEVPWGQLTWTSEGPAGTAALSVAWDLEELWYETPARILALFEAARESIAEDRYDAPFTGPSTNSAIGLGGGAGGGRFGRGGRRNLKAGGGAGLVTDEITLRRDFAPTLVFVPEALTDEEGRARLSVPLADSITTWGMRIVASADDGAVGVGHADLRVTQPLSVEPWVPSHLTVGDELDLPVALRNGADAKVTVKVRLESSPGIDILGGPGAEVEVLPGGTGAHTFRIRASAPGRAAVRVFAEAGTERDAVERAITVRPYAREVRDARSFVLKAGSVAPSVGDRGALRLDLYPSAVADTVAGFEALVREPHGCFEQTSSTVYPMTLALSYLRRTRQSAPEVEERASRYLAQGYARLLGYEVEEEPGGFSLFGQAPASVFLSAYGLMEFTDLRDVFPVDPELAPRVTRFLASQQRQDGSWDGDFALTAYVAWALSVAGTPSPGALLWLDARAGEVKDPYRLALAALAFLATDPSRGAAFAARARDAKGPVDATLVGARGRSRDAETLALVLQALLPTGAPECGSLLEGLVSMRTASGSFGTTQATVQALRALLAAETGASPAAGRVEVRERETLLATRDLEADAMEPVRLDLGERPRGPLRITLEGERRLRGMLTRTTWEPWAGPSAPGRVALEVRYPEGAVAVGRPHRLEVVITNPSARRATLVTAEIGLPPGCDAEASEVEGKGALRIERGETAMVLYLPDLEPRARLVFGVRFTPRYRLAVRTAPSRAYEYYTPEEAAVVPPALVRAE